MHRDELVHRFVTVYHLHALRTKSFERNRILFTACMRPLLMVLVLPVCANCQCSPVALHLVVRSFYETICKSDAYSDVIWRRTETRKTTDEKNAKRGKKMIPYCFTLWKTRALACFLIHFDLCILSLWPPKCRNVMGSANNNDGVKCLFVQFTMFHRVFFFAYPYPFTWEIVGAFTWHH